MKFLMILLCCFGFFVSIVNAQTRKPVLEMRDLMTEEQFELFTEKEQTELISELSAFNKDPYVRVAANGSDRMYAKAFCLGGKAALVVFGFQGFKCLDTNKKLITITMNDERWGWTAVTGLVVDGYIGLNAGLSLLAGVAILSGPYGEFRWSGEFGRRSSNDIEGGTLNGAFGLVGGYAAYFEKENLSLTIVAYQAGLAIELSASKVQVHSN